MRSIPLAMTWEMLSRGRWGLIAAALGANVLPAMLFTALRHEVAVDPGDPSLIVMHVVLVQINMFLFGAAVFAAQGAPSRLYAFPVPTSSLVAWQMLPAMAVVALESLASTALLNAAFDLGWPLWGPALFVAVAVASVQAAMWSTEKSAWLPWTIIVVGVLLGVWFKSRYGATFSQPTRMWLEVTPLEVVTALVIALLAYSVAVIGVARNRRGDTLPSLGILAWLERLFDPAPEVGLPFRSPAHAQIWFEWRKKGGAMPAAVVFGMLMGFGYWLIFSRDAKELFEGFVAGGGLLSVVGIVGAISMGNCGPNEANFEMGHFLATRPMTNTNMAHTILKTSAKSILVAWIIWAVAFLTLYVILLAIQSFPQPVGWWYFPATLLGPWIVVTSLALVGLTGRSRPFVQLFCGLFALFIGLSLFSKFALSHRAQEQFGRGAMVAIGVVFVLGTAWAFVSARRRSLIGTPTVYVASSVWAALNMLVVLEWVLHPEETFPVYAFVIGLAALAVAPLATAPLALAWNRNR